jgi:pSer/pThr/pTyr-binding forkhead associated (FHA) protein
MLDFHSLAEYSSQILSAPDNVELEQRLGLYRVFLKLYEHHRGLLDEILELEHTGGRSRARLSFQYVEGVVQDHQRYLITNLIKGKTQSLLQPQDIWVIGRDRKVSLAIQDRRLSRRHAVIQYVENQGFYLIDLHSTNGSFVNGEPVRQCVLLRDGNQVRLGSLTFTFFLCYASKLLDSLSSEFVRQLDTLRSAAKPLPEDALGSDWDGIGAGIEWDTPLANSADETSMFLRPAMPAEELHLDPKDLLLSSIQQAEILDRFLNRSVESG